MKPSAELSNDIFLEKVDRAREAAIEEKLLDGPRLFAFACEAVRAGIRAQHPDASPEQVTAILNSRLRIMQQLEDINRG